MQSHQSSHCSKLFFSNFHLTGHLYVQKYLRNKAVFFSLVNITNTESNCSQGSQPGGLMSWERPFVWAAGPGGATGNTHRCKLSPMGEQGSRREEVMNGVKVQDERNHRGIRVGERWRTDGRGACMERSGLRPIWWCQAFWKVGPEVQQHQLSPLLGCHRKQGGPHTNKYPAGRD